MKHIYSCLFLALFFVAPLQGGSHSAPEQTQETLDITPYLLPQDHPLQQVIHEIFSSERILQNYRSFSKNGFTIISDRKRNRMKVVSHPKAPGYLFKFFIGSDDFLSLPRQRKNFLQRCQGARIIEDVIQQHNILYFCVPKKWIYELPNGSVVLIVEQMDILSGHKTKRAWKTVITPQHLQELYILIDTLPISRRFDENLPYTKQGKFAFIDTEKRHKKFLSIQKFLSPSMQSYWLGLIKQKERETNKG